MNNISTKYTHTDFKLQLQFPRCYVSQVQWPSTCIGNLQRNNQINNQNGMRNSLRNTSIWTMCDPDCVNKFPPTMDLAKIRSKFIDRCLMIHKIREYLVSTSLHHTLCARNQVLIHQKLCAVWCVGPGFEIRYCEEGKILCCGVQPTNLVYPDTQS